MKWMDPDMEVVGLSFPARSEAGWRTWGSGRWRLPLVPLSKVRERESYEEKREATRRYRSKEERRGGPGLMAAGLLTDELRLWVLLLGPNHGGAWAWINRRRGSLVGLVVKTRRWI